MKIYVFFLGSFYGNFCVFGGRKVGLIIEKEFFILLLE